MTRSRARARTFYRVSLGCAAAPGLGCGSRAKPLLLGLERAPAVTRAWLNRAGTLLAVEWKDAAVHGLVARAVTRVSRTRATLLRGGKRTAVTAEFASLAGWYRGRKVDRLSGEEAKVIAARLVRRLQARSALSGRKARALRSAAARACADELVHQGAGSQLARRRRIARKIVAAASRYLNAVELAAFRQMVARGHRPLRGEI